MGQRPDHGATALRFSSRMCCEDARKNSFHQATQDDHPCPVISAKYSPSLFPKSMIDYPHPVLLERGASRSSRTLGAGGGGRSRSQRAWIARGRTASCGREIAWSWRPDAGAKSSGDDDPRRRRWLSSRTPGRSRISVKTIARGMPDDPAEPVVTAACYFFCRRAMGEALTRHSPRPLFAEGGTN